MADRASKGGGIMTPLNAGVGPLTPGTGITTGTGADWFGPGNPLNPIAPPQVRGRSWDFQPAQNMNVQPRQREVIGFATLRGLADAYDVLRTVIETRKDQICGLKFRVQPKNGDHPDPEQAVAITRITDFLAEPQKGYDWQTWLRRLIEDVLVIDAPTIYPRYTRGGDLYELRIFDGATINRLIDDWGETPAPPAPAYQQVLHGMAAVDYTADDLIYRPRNPRPGKAFGFSPVEQIAVMINIAVRREVWQLRFFTEGTQPDALIGTPDDWTPDQVRAFQDWWDSVQASAASGRRGVRFVPGAVAKSYVPTKETELFGEAEEWLARVVCFAFSISPQAFVKMMNRATAGTQKESSLEEGLGPLKIWVQSLMDHIIAVHLRRPDLSFQWDEEEVVDQAALSTMMVEQTKIGLRSIDEAREEMGLDALGGDFSKPMVLLGTGYTPVDQTDAQAQAKAMAEINAPPVPPGGPEGPPDGSVPPGGKKAATDDPEGGKEPFGKFNPNHRGPGDEHGGEFTTGADGSPGSFAARLPEGATWRDIAMAARDEALGQSKRGDRRATLIAHNLDEAMQTVEQNASWADWYDRNHELIDAAYGQNADMFRGILAATSINTAPKQNVENAVRLMDHWLQGGNFDAGQHLGVTNQVLHAIRQFQTEGHFSPTAPKISNFLANMRGDMSAVTIDRWMNRILFGDYSRDTASTLQYRVGQRVVTRIAEHLGWAPARLQAAMWAAAMVRDGSTPSDFAQFMRSSASFQNAIIRRQQGVGKAAGEQGPPLSRAELAQAFEDALTLALALTAINARLGGHPTPEQVNAALDVQPVAKFNPNHQPAGNEHGGEFAPKDGGGGGVEAAAQNPHVSPVALQALGPEGVANLQDLIAHRASVDQVLAALEPAAHMGDDIAPTLGEGETPTDEFWDGRTYRDGMNIDQAMDYLNARADGFAGPEGPGHDHQITIVTGPPAAGKSTIAEALASNSRSAILDADEAKAIIPEFRGGIGAGAVHEESKAMAAMLAESMARSGVNIVHPVVGHDARKLSQLVAQWTARGYHVQVVNVNVTADEAARRMAGRFLATGRLIDPNYFATVAGAPLQTYALLRQNGTLSHDYAQIDANGPPGSARVTESAIPSLRAQGGVFGKGGGGAASVRTGLPSGGGEHSGHAPHTALGKRRHRHPTETGRRGRASGATTDLSKFNPNHAPAGDEHGGEFVSGDGAASTGWAADGPVAPEPTADQPPGVPFTVYRLGGYHGPDDDTRLFIRNAGNSAAIANRLQEIDGGLAPMGNDNPEAVSRYEVTINQPWGGYRAMVGGYVESGGLGSDKDPPGREALGVDGIETYSFGTRGFTARLTGSVPLSSVLREYNARGASRDNFDFTNVGDLASAVRSAFRPNPVAKYSPDQPRDPAGTPTGGQWTSGSAQVSWEATPGATTGTLEGIIQAPVEQQAEYLRAVHDAMLEDGHDVLAEAAGLETGQTVEGFSAWEGNVGAGAQTFETLPESAMNPDGTVGDDYRARLDGYASAIGLALRQEAVPWHMPIWSTDPATHNGFQMRTSRPLTEAEHRLLYDAISREFGRTSLAPAYMGDGARVLNFESDITNSDFQGGMRAVARSLPEGFGGGGPIRVAGYQSDGNYLSNDWRAHPDGGDYRGAIDARGPAFSAATDRVMARVAAVNARFAAHYGWRNPGPGKAFGADGLDKANPNHYPAGSPRGGQFAPKAGGVENANATLSDGSPVPVNTITAYKQFRTLKTRPGELFPLFIGNQTPVPVGEWVPAQFIPTNGFAPRPGWHAGELPIGYQLRSREAEPQRQEGRVWAQVSLPADVNWQRIVDSTPGAAQRGLRDRVPVGGHYRFVEPSQARGRGVPWIIGGAMRVDRVLSDSDVAGVLRHAGRTEEIAAETRGAFRKFNPNHRPAGDEHGGEFTTAAEVTGPFGPDGFNADGFDAEGYDRDGFNEDMEERPGAEHDNVARVLQRAGLKLGDVSDLTLREQTLVGVNFWPGKDGGDPQPQPVDWTVNRLAQAEGLARAMSTLRTQGLDRAADLVAATPVIFAPLNMDNSYVYAMVYQQGDRQFLILNANMSPDHMSVASVNAPVNNIAGRFARTAFAQIPQGGADAVRASMAAFTHASAIHEFGHILDNASAGGMAAALQRTIEIAGHVEPGLTLQWARNNISHYGGQDIHEAAAEAFTARVLNLRRPDTLHLWEDSVMNIARHAPGSTP